MTHALENPIWHALADSQSHLAQCRGNVRRFPAEIAPFVAVPEPSASDPDDLRELVAPGETVDFVAVRPQLDDRWDVADCELIEQMHIDVAVPVPPGGDIVVLGDADAEAMLALTKLVYPGYFRPRTRELGRYFGIKIDGRLAAMAGERMQIGDYREISAVCTHPEQLGRGHAQRLVAHLVEAIRAKDQRPFLHVSAQNTRALALYRRLGVRTERGIGIWLAMRG